MVRFLGMWLDEKLTWRQHIDKVKDKCKKVNNLLAYMLAADFHLRKLDVQQAQGLRTCSGAFKSSPVAAVQVKMGEQPLRIRRGKPYIFLGIKSALRKDVQIICRYTLRS